jgi:hypothetical protein
MSMVEDKSDLEIAIERLTPVWLAGFFDGEGCVSISTRHNGEKNGKVYYPRLSVSITQSEPTILSLILMKFCGPKGEMFQPVRKKTQKEKKPCYNIRVTGKSAREFLEYIQPHVILKRRVVELGIEMTYLFGQQGSQKHLTPENVARRNEIMRSVASENASERKIRVVA